MLPSAGSLEAASVQTGRVNSAGQTLLGIRGVPTRVCFSSICSLGENVSCSSASWEQHALTRLVVHHANGFGFGQLQGCHPSLPLHLRAGLQVIRAPATAQHDVAGVLRVDVRGGQVDGSAARVGHLRLSSAANE